MWALSAKSLMCCVTGVVSVAFVKFTASHSHHLCTDATLVLSASQTVTCWRPSHCNRQYKPSLRWSFTTFSYPTFAEALACPKYSGLDRVRSWSACRDLRTKHFYHPFWWPHGVKKPSDIYGLMMSHSK